jgi:hypothetical protein
MRTGASPLSRLCTTRRPRFAKSEWIAPVRAVVCRPTSIAQGDRKVVGARRKVATAPIRQQCQARGCRPPRGGLSAVSHDRFSNSGSLAKMAANTPRLVARKQLTAAMSVTRLFFEIHVGKGLPVQIFHHKTGVQFLDGPGLRKVALRHSLLKHARHPSAPRNRQQAAPCRGAAAF